MMLRMMVVALGGFGVAMGLDWIADRVAANGEPDTDPEADPGPEDGPDDDQGDDGGDDREELREEVERLRASIEGHLERLADRVPEGQADRVEEILQRLEAQKAANTDLLERLRRLEGKLETTSAGPPGGDPDDGEPEDQGDD
jgi:molecular chaperone DnaK (HSP70)